MCVHSNNVMTSSSHPNKNHGKDISNSNQKHLSFLQLLYYLIEPGSGKFFAPWEIPLFYGSPLLLLLIVSYCCNDDNNAWSSSFLSLAFQNIKNQFLLFLFVVQIPLLLTGKMTYVDIGWPTGLVLLAYQILVHDNVIYESRVPYAGIMLLLHGGRLACGAYYVFFPYIFDKDLPRYEYAHERWIQLSGSNNEWLWKVKQQQETLLQAFANAFFIGIPLCLVATNPRLRNGSTWLEVVAAVCWLLFWCLESWADGQKVHFLVHNTKENRKTAVLGYPPYDQYWLWTWCRHPNYFCEWMCWNSVALLSVSSAWEFVIMIAQQQQQHHQKSSTVLYVLLLFSLTCIYLCRVFYDCLRYWTGSEPAEARSVQRRPLYRKYQDQTPPFFPRRPQRIPE